MLETLQTLDERLFVYLNGKHHAALDGIMYWSSNSYTWIPFYLFLFFLLYRRYKKFMGYILAWVVLMITASDQLSSNLIKNWVRRPRPSHVLRLAGQIHLSLAGPGGEYGFVSSHAANVSALTVFLILILPRNYRLLKYLLVCWALLVSYSRIYNGVHYPGDVLGGILLGSLIALLFYRAFRRFVGYITIRTRARPGRSQVMDRIGQR